MWKLSECCCLLGCACQTLHAAQHALLQLALRELQPRVLQFVLQIQLHATSRHALHVLSDKYTFIPGKVDVQQQTMCATYKLSSSMGTKSL